MLSNRCKQVNGRCYSCLIKRKKKTFLTGTDHVEQFVEDVTEQIKYKPIRASIEEELRGHLEDRAEEYSGEGMDSSSAVKKAVEQMGNPSEIGIRLNEEHQVKNNWLLPMMILGAVALGIIRNNSVYGAVYGFRYNNYFFFGILVLALSIFKGYTLLIKHTKVFFILLLAVWGSGVISFIIGNNPSFNIGFYISYSPILHFFMDYFYLVLLFQCYFFGTGQRVSGRLLYMLQ